MSHLPGQNSLMQKVLPLGAALRVKSAEYWLELGEPAQAMKELECLPSATRRHPWVIKTLVNAIGALRRSGSSPVSLCPNVL